MRCFSVLFHVWSATPSSTQSQVAVSYSVAVTPAIARVLTWNWCRRGSAASNVRTSRTNDDRGKCAATANRTKPSESEVLVSRSIRMANLDTIIPTSLKVALDNEVAKIKGTLSSVVTAALSQYLDVQVHTLFQVSTSGALVAGVYDREVSVRAILGRGDFGLGTFANLDGEMVEFTKCRVPAACPKQAPKLARLSP